MEITWNDYTHFVTRYTNRYSNRLSAVIVYSNGIIRAPKITDHGIDSFSHIIEIEFILESK